jgi:CheY-like chemotaxis protein
MPEALEGRETILLVEDEELVRQLTAKILDERGYRILEAADGREALEVVASFEDAIHLLLTDVVMPGMPGTVLARRTVSLRPSIKVLFMSGYSEEAVESPTGHLAGVRILQKPFEARDLLTAVREVLESTGSEAVPSSR